MAYDRSGSDYRTSLSGSGSVGRLGSAPDHHDPLSIHQALQNAVDDQDQNQVCDETATNFMTDLPLLKSECFIYSKDVRGRIPGERKLDTLKGKQELQLMRLLAWITIGSCCISFFLLFLGCNLSG